MLFVVCPCLALTIPFTNITEIYFLNASHGWYYLCSHGTYSLILTIYVHRTESAVAMKGQTWARSQLLFETLVRQMFFFLFSLYLALSLRSFPSFSSHCSSIFWSAFLAFSFGFIRSYSGWYASFFIIIQHMSLVFGNFLIFLMRVFFVVLFLFPLSFACYLYLQFKLTVGQIGSILYRCTLYTLNSKQHTMHNPIHFIHWIIMKNSRSGMEHFISSIFKQTTFVSDHAFAFATYDRCSPYSNYVLVYNSNIVECRV